MMPIAAAVGPSWANTLFVFLYMIEAFLLCAILLWWEGDDINMEHEAI
jgi:hypothetical protein